MEEPKNQREPVRGEILTYLAMLLVVPVVFVLLPLGSLISESLPKQVAPWALLLCTAVFFPLAGGFKVLAENKPDPNSRVRLLLGKISAWLLLGLVPFAILASDRSTVFPLNAARIAITAVGVLILVLYLWRTNIYEHRTHSVA
jgi:hypothetical protein